MWQRLPDAAAAEVVVVIDGQPCSAARGDSVAAALLAHGRSAFRTAPVSGVPRGPYCMMGVCFECLVTIDGCASRQACMVRVEEGMRIETTAQRRP